MFFFVYTKNYKSLNAKSCSIIRPRSILGLATIDIDIRLKHRFYECNLVIIIRSYESTD